MRAINQHIRRVTIFALLILLSSCQTIQFERPQNLSGVDWPTDGQTEARSRFVNESLELPMELAWEYSANAGFGTGSPLVLQDRVLVGNRKGEVHTVDIETGRGRGFKQMGESVEGSPLIHDGTMYVPLAWGKRVLIAFDLSSGTNRWRARGVPFATALIAHHDTVIGIDLEGTLRAYSTGDGEEAWSLELASYRTFKASPVRVSDTSILVVDISGRVYRVNLDSKEVEWTADLDAPVYETPAVEGAQVVLTTTRGSVHLLDVNGGSAVWNWQGPEHLRIGAPAMGNGYVVAGTTGGAVLAIDRSTGERAWEAQFDDVISAAPLIVGDHVFVGTLGEKLIALQLGSGERDWETDVRGRIKSAMAVADGGLLVLSEPKWVLYFKPAGEVPIDMAQDESEKDSRGAAVTAFSAESNGGLR